MSLFSTNIHGIGKIELASTYIENGNSRTVRITTRGGQEYEFVLFGETDVLDALPRSADFCAHKWTVA